MKQLSIFAFLCMLLFGCKGTGKSSSNNDILKDEVTQQTVRTDTVLIEGEKVSVFIIPTNEDIHRMKSQYDSEEDFQTIADDAAYYSYEASNYLNKQAIDVLYIDTTCRVINFGNSFYIDLSDTATIHNALFDIILYKKDNRPAIIPSIEIKNDAQHYFSLEKTIEDIPSVGDGKGVKDNKWVGVYQMEVGYDKQNGNAFMVTLTITNDSVIYSAEGHTLDHEYRLSVTEEHENYIKLDYYKQIDNRFALYALKETTDFGTLEYQNGEYIWKNIPYLAIMTEENEEYKLIRK